jgi:hypothetical protein
MTTSTSATNYEPEPGLTSQEGLVDLVQLREGLQQVMPIALVQVSGEAAERVRAVSDADETEAERAARNNLAHVFAAALGTLAPAVTTAAVAYWLTTGPGSRMAFVPRWLRPRIDPERTPILATMTSFANDRSRIVRQAIEDSTPVLISRHGQVLAAIVPLEPGAYEATAYEAAGRARMVAAHAAPPAVQLDEKTVDAILTAEDPAKEAAARGIDTSDWATLNPAD